MKSEDYVSQQEGAYRVGGTRVSLDSIVYAFLEGQTPETPAGEGQQRWPATETFPRFDAAIRKELGQADMLVATPI